MIALFVFQQRKVIIQIGEKLKLCEIQNSIHSGDKL